MRLAERLTKLEQVTTQVEKVFIVKWVAPNDLHREIQTLRRGAQHWVRQADESEDAFIARAKGDVERSEHGVTMLFADIDLRGQPLCDGEQGNEPHRASR